MHGWWFLGTRRHTTRIIVVSPRREHAQVCTACLLLYACGSTAMRTHNSTATFTRNHRNPRNVSLHAHVLHRACVRSRIMLNARVLHRARVCSRVIAANQWLENTHIVNSMADNTCRPSTPCGAGQYYVYRKGQDADCLACAAHQYQPTAKHYSP